MKKHMIAYLVLCLPAVLVAYLFNNSSMLSQGLQWAFALLMTTGWAINSGVTAYYYPRSQLALLLFYTGATTLLITLKYASDSGTLLYELVRQWGGIISFKPLGIFVRALRDFQIPHEFYVMGFFIGLMLVGYLVGILLRRVSPNPYRPRIMK